MTRGIIKLQINKREPIPKSRKKKDQYKILDKLQLSNFIDEKNRKKFYCESLELTSKPKVKISRDELAFIRLIHFYYGDGDYCIKMWGKGKSRGFRRFWDGLISKHKKFQRRKEASYMKEDGNVSVFERRSFALNTESYVGKYMKTKRPGVWWDF